jgi:hypothetical protein
VAWFVVAPGAADVLAGTTGVGGNDAVSDSPVSVSVVTPPASVTVAGNVWSW